MKKTENALFCWDWKSFLVGVDTAKDRDYRYWWFYLGPLQIGTWFKINRKKV
ncbi:MAG: hypothetical protein IK122_00455 [Alphaproteobacteria bacterium]|nr:hypothetical protein [Alphaproteobacteria bacterium]